LGASVRIPVIAAMLFLTACAQPPTTGQAPTGRDSVSPRRTSGTSPSQRDYALPAAPVRDPTREDALAFSRLPEAFHREDNGILNICRTGRIGEWRTAAEIRCATSRTVELYSRYQHPFIDLFTYRQTQLEIIASLYERKAIEDPRRHALHDQLNENVIGELTRRGRVAMEKVGPATDPSAAISGTPTRPAQKMPAYTVPPVPMRTPTRQDAVLLENIDWAMVKKRAVEFVTACFARSRSGELTVIEASRCVSANVRALYREHKDPYIDLIDYMQAQSVTLTELTERGQISSAEADLLNAEILERVEDEQARRNEIIETLIGRPIRTRD
jgi:hypothetical protein